MNKTKNEVILNFYYKSKVINQSVVLLYYATLNLANSKKIKVFKDYVFSDNEDTCIAIAYYSVLSQLKMPVKLHIISSDVVKLQSLAKVLPELKIILFPHDISFETIKKPRISVIDKLSEVDKIKEDELHKICVNFIEHEDFIEVA